MQKEKIYLTVTALNKYISKKFELDPYLREIYLKGELSNLKIHNRNNMYFSLKDQNTKIDAMKFGCSDDDIKNLKEGDNVLIKARINFYFPRGTHSILVEDIKKDKIGDLYQKFLELKEKLEKEGIFSSKYKKKIPKFSNKIAVVTAATGAAVQDIKRTILRRYPISKINIYSTLVQGENSINDIVKNIKKADEDNNDVIILARGGGSIEDLWSFNSEAVVRAIFSCNTPLVTGIGHETDTTLSDFVADCRASTPTAAAEIVTPNIKDIKKELDIYNKKLNSLIENKIRILKTDLINKKDNYYLKNYSNIYTLIRNNLLVSKKTLNRNILTIINESKKDCNFKKNEFLSIDILKTYKLNFERIIKELEANSPIKILQQGYSITYDENMKKINSVKNVKKKDNINVKLSDGLLLCSVESIKEEGI